MFVQWTGEVLVLIKQQHLLLVQPSVILQLSISLLKLLVGSSELAVLLSLINREDYITITLLL